MAASSAAAGAGGEPQKQLLSIIRDFAAEKSHGGKRSPSTSRRRLSPPQGFRVIRSRHPSCLQSGG